MQASISAIEPRPAPRDRRHTVVTALRRPAVMFEITRYVNAEQKSPTDEAAMRRQLLSSGFFGLSKAREIIGSDQFRSGLEDQIRFFLETRQIAATIPLDRVIVRDLLTG